MHCPQCGMLVGPQANFCQQCGSRIPREVADNLEPPKLKPRLDVFFLSIVLTLALSFILTFVFHLPIFIFGAFLPLFWMGSRKRTR